MYFRPAARTSIKVQEKKLAEAKVKIKRSSIIEHIRLGHPLVFREALERLTGLANGQVVSLVDKQGEFVARGTIEPDSPVAFRVWTLDSHENIDEKLLQRRLSRAAELRQGLRRQGVTGYRLCHGENDFIPGLQCDIYNSIASLRTDGQLGVAWEERFVEAVRVVANPKGIVVRNPHLENGAARVRAGRIPEEIEITEGRRRYYVNVLAGQKTGFFLDQRENRDRLALWAKGKRVLNCYAYTGGFSVAAALAGAPTVCTVDIAPEAIAMAKRNFVLNNISLDEHDFLARDVMEVLEQVSGQSPQPRYDLIILDPPSFAPREKSLPQAKKAYEKINYLALRSLPAGGLLATASCSSHLREKDFLQIIAQAACRARRQVRTLGIYGAGADHPTRPYFPEGQYLKFVLISVD